MTHVSWKKGIHQIVIDLQEGRKMEVDIKERNKKMAKLLAKVWSDETFKKRLLSDSRAVLESEGIIVPPGVEVKVLEQTENVAYFVIPILPNYASPLMVEERVAAQVWHQCTLSSCIP